MKEKFKTWEEIATTDRGLEDYLRDLKLTPEMLEGKKILDVGSGTRRFAKELQEAGINAEVISIDPVFASPEKKMRVQGDTASKLRELIENTDIEGIKDKTIAAIGEALPFKDNVFDLIVADNSLPAYGNKEQIDQFFAEVFRVLKDNGEFRFTPSYTMFRRGAEYPLDKDLEAIISKLEKDKKFKIIKKGSGQDYTVLNKIPNENKDKTKTRLKKPFA